MELLALRAVAPRRAARGGWVEGASLTTTEPPALRGLVLSQRDKTHHQMPATFNRTPTTVASRDRAVASGMCSNVRARCPKSGHSERLAGLSIGGEERRNRRFSPLNPGKESVCSRRVQGFGDLGSARASSITQVHTHLFTEGRIAR